MAGHAARSHLVAVAGPRPAPDPAPATVVALPPRRRYSLEAARVVAAQWLTVIVPPIVVLAALLLIWEIGSSGPKASLPPPSKIWSDSRDLILEPFFVAGPQDIGLGFRVLTSLQRVAIGFGLAAIAGVALGALVGQSVWAMRGLDPIFQVLRTVPPLAWLPI
jgi:nitrate/nitrite transport system permease protein